MKSTAGNLLAAFVAIAICTPMVGADFEVVTLAGLLNQTGKVDGGPGVARFWNPRGLVLTSAGNLVVMDGAGNGLRIVDGSRNTTSWNVGGDSILAGNSISTDAQGNFYVADVSGKAIHQITSEGVATVLVPSTAGLSFPNYASPDKNGNLYIADTFNQVIRKRAPDGTLSVFAGAIGNPGYADGTGGNARFNYPSVVVIDASNNIYVADNTPVLRKIDPNGNVTTVAGQSQGPKQHLDGARDVARFTAIFGIAAAASGDVYVTDGDSTIRRVSQEGSVLTVAGRFGVRTGVDGVGTAATFLGPAGLYATDNGYLYVAASGESRIRRISIPVGSGNPGGTNNGPTIVTNPSSTNLITGGTLNLSVSASADGFLSFQWKRNGTPLANATNAVFNIVTVALSDAGTYVVDVTSGGKTVTSNPAVVGITPAGGISLISNGSFEDSSLNPGGGFVDATPEGAIVGWTTSGIQYSSQGTAADGSRYIHLNIPPGTSGSIRRTLTTKPGQKYTVRFRYAGHPSGTGGKIIPAMRVLLFGATPSVTLIEYPRRNTSFANLEWEVGSVIFTASTATQELWFASFNNGQPYGMLVDNVEVFEGDAPPVGPSTPTGLAGLNVGITETLTGASFRNAYAGCIVGRGGRVLVTGDGGATWTPSITGVTNDLTSIRLIGSAGFISGSGGLLCISTNNGLSWRSFTTGTTETFNALSFTRSTAGWAVGTRGTICIYNGRSWVPTPTDTTSDFNGVSALDSGIAFAVGSGGIICRYNGSRWIPQSTSTTLAFYGVDFLNESLGFAVGAQGLLCRYNGSAWVAVNSGVTANLRSVSIIDAQNIVVTGDGGLVLESGDGGSTWNRRVAGNGDLLGIAFSGGRGYFVGAGGIAFTFRNAAVPINQPPLIRITAPANNAVLSACFRIPISAQASDPDGTIGKVEFYRGEFRVAEVTRPSRNGSFSTEFHTDAIGEYTLRAVATDNRGATTVSEPVVVQVTPPPQFVAIAEEWNQTNGFTLCYLGVPGKSYILQAQSLLGTSPWVNLSTHVMVEPFLRVTDSTATNSPMRFYRFQSAP